MAEMPSEHELSAIKGARHTNERHRFDDISRVEIVGTLVGGMHAPVVPTRTQKSVKRSWYSKGLPLDIPRSK
jgi:hypothetical protein